MRKLFSLIISVGLLIALAGCQATDSGSAERQASEQPGVTKVSAETGGEKAGCTKSGCSKSCCTKDKSCGEKAAGGCQKACEKK